LKKKNNRNKKSNTGTRKNGSAKSKKSAFLFLKNEKFQKISGLFLILFSFILAISLISWIFTWWVDDASRGTGSHNWIGNFGRAISDFFVGNLFGLSSILFAFLFFIYGVRLLLKKRIIPLWKATRISILAMAWISVTLAYIFGDSTDMAGIFGLQTSAWLKQSLGPIGEGLLLLFLLLSFLIISYDFSIRFPSFSFFGKKKNNKDAKKGNASNPGEDIYNTAEFAVEDEEDEIPTGNYLEPEKTTEVDLTDTGNLVIEEQVKKEVTEVDDLELTIEKPVEEEKTESEESPVSNPDHKTIDEPYDPTLDLPDYQLPTLDLLEAYGTGKISVQKEELERNKNRIVETLGNYAIKISKIKATIGPTITLYEIIPAPGVRISKIKNLEDDIALSLSALGIRIIAPIPGKGTIGIEVPNESPDIVSMKSVLASDKFQNTKYELPFGIGKTISNESYVADLTKMPHLLMAGATGQGKSVGLNAVITSLLYRKHPAELKFVMVDPKKVELTLYSKIERHFLAKLPDSEEAIITDTRKVVRTLNSLSIEMDNRYELLKDAQVRNIKEYNVKFKSRKLSPLHGHRFLPYLVLVIDEFADLIMTAGKEIEVPITRLAQLARAVGIHLIIATQRPSVNIITGSIKANFPARIAFRVISKIDSRTILDSGGADQLIGRGDMLLSTGSDLIRLQCAFVDTPEIDRITDFIGSQRAYPDTFHLPEYADEEKETISEFDPNERDELFEDAALIIVQTQQGSTSLLQRKLKLGYNRAGRIIDQLEAAGIVGPFEGSKAREVRVANEMALEQFLKDLNNPR
jgi:S-DNA-T family DNA segregation ATPase FtsK/SpoIIIE